MLDLAYLLIKDRQLLFVQSLQVFIQSQVLHLHVIFLLVEDFTLCFNTAIPFGKQYFQLLNSR